MSRIALFKTKSFQILVGIILIVGAGIAFAVDTDNDGMSDLYENFFRLNPTNAVDAAENYDADTLVNQQEALLWTDPNESDTDTDGLNDGVDSNALSRAVMWWGRPYCTDGDEYVYTGPAWWLGAGKVGGTWLDGGGWQVSSNAQGMLYIDIDRAMVASNLMLNLLHQNTTNSLVYLDLADTNDAMVAVDLYGDLTSDDGEKILSRYVLPLAAYPAASRIVIDAQAGSQPYTVWAATLYEDSDADGLDADQEIQFGTLDSDPDCDADSLTDFLETMVEGTDPLDPDTDGDGYSDGEELYELGTSPTVPMWQEGGLPGVLQVERWNEINGAGIPDLTGSDRFGNEADEISWVSSSEYPQGDGDYYGIRIRGTITAPAAGAYTFFLTGDDSAQVWLSDTESPYGRRMLLDLKSWTGFRDLSNSKVPSATVELSSNQTCYVEILFKENWGGDHVALWWTRPGQTDPEIIGSQYLHSYVQPADDADMDGLPDKFDPDPTDGTGGGYLDPDADGLSDVVEICQYGTSPTVPMWKDGGVAGYLQAERWDGIVGKSLAILATNTHFGAVPDERFLLGSTDYAPLGYGDDNCVLRMRGTLTAPVAGTYTFRLTGDDAAQVWLSDEASPYGRRLLLDLREHTDYQDLGNPGVPSATIELASNQTCYVEILLKEDGYYEHVSLWWTRPGQSEPEIIGSQYLHSYIQPDDDADMDGLPDELDPAPSDGTGGGYFDSDKDGLSDLVEIMQLGTSPMVPIWQGGGMAGHLLADRWNGIEGGNVASLVTNVLFGARPDERFLLDSSEYAPANLDNGGNYGLRIRGTITAPVSGTYAVTLTGDDAAQLWLSDSASPYGRRLLLDLGRWTDYRDVSGRGVPSTFVPLAANTTYYVEILYKEAGGFDHLGLWWTLPGQSAPELIDPQYLHSYIRPTDDIDQDGLPDTWETACGLSSSNQMGVAYLDGDGDGYCNIEECQAGMDPWVRNGDGDSDGLSDRNEAVVSQTDPLLADTDADGINDLTVVQTLHGTNTVTRYSEHYATTWSNAVDGVHLTQLPWFARKSYVAYEIESPAAGMHQVTLKASWTNGLPVVEERPLVAFYVDGYFVEMVRALRTADGNGAYTFFTPWLEPGRHTVKCVPQLPGITVPGFTIRSLELGAIDGADADRNGIQDWMEAILAKGYDTDGDGITDADELLIHGTGVLDADSDNDGLSDSEELALGSDPLNADTDGDGVIDGVEVNEILTDLLTAEFDGTSTTVLTVPGAQTNSAAGVWEAVGSEILSKGRRGYVEYTMNFPEQDLYCLTINAKCSDNSVMLSEASHLQIYVDGVYIGSYPLVSENGGYADVRSFLPVMPTGEHIVRVFWENTVGSYQLRIKDLKLQSLGGPDSNGNGMKDWIEVSLSTMAGVDTTESYISPACIEGDARYVPFMNVVDDASSFVPVAQSAGPRWYANLPLEQDGITTATAFFQNGAFEVPVNVEWVPYNLIGHDGETLYVRKGDMVKFVALPDEAVGGQFEIEYTLGMDGETVRSPNTRPLIYLFPSAGTYTVTGEYTHGNDVVSASIQVVALDGSFPVEPPACLVGRERVWRFSGMSSNVVYEADKSVEVSLESYPSFSNQQTTLALNAGSPNGEHALVARAGENGPILDTIKIDTFWIQNAVDGYFWTVEVYEDSELWEVESIAKNVPESVSLQIKVIIGGVTLDDYTVERWINNGSYNEVGIYQFRLFHPDGSSASTCHTFKAYQNGQLIGEAYGSGETYSKEE